MCSCVIIGHLIPVKLVLSSINRGILLGNIVLGLLLTSTGLPSDTFPAFRFAIQSNNIFIFNRPRSNYSTTLEAVSEYSLNSLHSFLYLFCVGTGGGIPNFFLDTLIYSSKFHKKLVFKNLQRIWKTNTTSTKSG